MSSSTTWRTGQLTSLLRVVRGRTVPAAPAPAPRAAAGAGAGELADPASLPAAPVPAGLDALVDGLDPARRRQVVAPLDLRAGRTVRWGTAAARQVDGTTCGAAVLGVLAAAGDPVLAAWLVTGRLPDGVVPPELDGLVLPEPADPTDPDAPVWFRSPDDRVVHAAATGTEASATRWALLQAALHRRSTTRAVAGVLPWPRSLGTPPWGAARVARFGRVPGLRYRAVMVDDTRTDEVADLLARVDAALDRGVPVPLYSGGDLRDGIAAALPRHVVLAVGRTADDYRVYEPGAGAVLPLPRAALLAPDGPVPALGAWTHLTWALLPVRAC
ncbi:hypothetical protein [Cellulomonas sp. NPDC058312]|uniref:hypothetical protein n=1 Tax=Cellulomonas sp. NPDC058312 TaxID=3346441 RepID=UPI0036E0504A